MKKSFIALFLMFVSVVSMAETSQGENFASTSNDDNIARAEAGGDIVDSGYFWNCSWTLDSFGNFVMSSLEDSDYYTIINNYLCPWKGYYKEKVKTIQFKGKIRVTSNCSEMFSRLYNLRSIDFGELDTSEVNDMSFMFSGCNSLVTLDLSSFETHGVTDMSFMFSGCNSLTTLDLSSFDTYRVTDMRSMFSGCNSLTTLDLSSFDTHRVTDMSSMFSGCNSLTILDLYSFDTYSVTDMSYMFENCRRLLTINVCKCYDNSYEKGFETKHVKKNDRHVSKL